MRLLNIRGRLTKKNVSRYLIRWDGSSKSQLQFRVKQFFKPYWCGHIVYEEFPVYGSLLRVDILNATLRVAIEVQGPQHSQFHYFHGKQPLAYLDSIKKDVAKQEWLEKNDFNFVEINFDEVDKLSPQFIREQFGIVL